MSELNRNRVFLIQNKNKEITGMGLECHGKYYVPFANCEDLRPKDDFYIDSTDAGILLAQYNPDTIVQIRDPYHATYYMNKNSSLIGPFKDMEKHLQEYVDEIDSLKKEKEKINSDLYHQKLQLNNLELYVKAYNFIPKWLRILFIKKSLRKKINEYESKQ